MEDGTGCRVIRLDYLTEEDREGPTSPRGCPLVPTPLSVFQNKEGDTTGGRRGGTFEGAGRASRHSTRKQLRKDN